MKKFTIILILLVSTIFVQGQKDIVIPNGVVYNKASESINKKANTIIKSEISNPTYSMFDKLLYCGPNFWKNYKNTLDISGIEAGNIKFQVPQSDGSVIEMDGKLIQSQSDFETIWNQISKDFKKTNYKIRKLTSNELSYYWSIIFFDINEPIYVIENKNNKIILDFYEGKMKIAFIENL